jgi:hypothetical protein
MDFRRPFYLAGEIVLRRRVNERDHRTDADIGSFIGPRARTSIAKRVVNFTRELSKVCFAGARRRDKAIILAKCSGIVY